MNCFCKTTASARLWLYLKRLYLISSAIAYCISPYASFYAGLSCCNFLLYSATEKLINWPQCVKHKLARIGNNVETRDHNVVNLLRELHWLPACSRITFKVASLGYTALRLEPPSYLHETLHLYAPSQTLHSSDQNPLAMLISQTKSADFHVWLWQCGTHYHQTIVTVTE